MDADFLSTDYCVQDIYCDSHITVTEVTIADGLICALRCDRM
jgi:hypothetical protein